MVSVSSSPGEWIHRPRVDRRVHGVERGAPLAAPSVSLG